MAIEPKAVYQAGGIKHKRALPIDPQAVARPGRRPWQQPAIRCANLLIDTAVWPD